MRLAPSAPIRGKEIRGSKSRSFQGVRNTVNIYKVFERDFPIFTKTSSELVTSKNKNSSSFISVAFNSSHGLKCVYQLQGLDPTFPRNRDQGTKCEKRSSQKPQILSLRIRQSNEIGIHIFGTLQSSPFNQPASELMDL